VQAGVTFVQPPTRTPWGMQAVFDDTCGNLILLHQADG
ncbi:MAG: VOC family protein, partial [Anaerolineae bacterium]